MHACHYNVCVPASRLDTCAAMCPTPPIGGSRVVPVLALLQWPQNSRRDKRRQSPRPKLVARRFMTA
eukprot:4826823-Amphidinium_carterae.1